MKLLVLALMPFLLATSSLGHGSRRYCNTEIKCPSGQVCLCPANTFCALDEGICTKRRSGVFADDDDAALEDDDAGTDHFDDDDAALTSDDDDTRYGLPPGRCNRWNPCAYGACCSKWGYCGFGFPWCYGKHNPNAPISIDGRCGQHLRCPYGTCCSKWGWCGVGAPWCGRRSNSFDDSALNDTNTFDNGTSSSFHNHHHRPLQPGQCNRRYPCQPGYCCSRWGWCGIGAPWCESEGSFASSVFNDTSLDNGTSFGASSFHNHHRPLQPGQCNRRYPCQPGYCCSRWGWCGVGAPWCENEGSFSGFENGTTFSDASSFHHHRRLKPGQCNRRYPCQPGYCCSRWGWCGIGAPWCESEVSLSSSAFNDTASSFHHHHHRRLKPGQCNRRYPCQPGYCCSRWGWCGIGAPWCENEGFFARFENGTSTGNRMSEADNFDEDDQGFNNEDDGLNNEDDTFEAGGLDRRFGGSNSSLPQLMAEERFVGSGDASSYHIITEANETVPFNKEFRGSFRVDYEPGDGFCDNKVTDAATEMAVAVSSKWFTSQDIDESLCSSCVNITLTSDRTKVVKAVIHDKCVACSRGELSISTAAAEGLALNAPFEAVNNARWKFVACSSSSSSSSAVPSADASTNKK